jgi:drug/metabolite transporter (DMT)-like permease
VVARPVGLRLHNVSLFSLRAILGFGAMLAYFTAAHGIGVADLSLIGKMQPIVVAIIAPLLLGASEAAGGSVWLILLLGMSGCALILAPDVSIGSTYGLFALAGAVLSACAHVCVRGLSRTDDTRVQVFWFQGAVMVLAGAVMAIEDPSLFGLPSAAMWPYLLGIAVAATAGQLSMTQAYAEDRAPVVAAASYAAPVWALLADLVVFSINPSWNVIIGGGIIVMAGLYLLFGLRDPVAEPVG